MMKKIYISKVVKEVANKVKPEKGIVPGMGNTSSFIKNDGNQVLGKSGNIANFKDSSGHLPSGSHQRVQSDSLNRGYNT